MPSTVEPRNSLEQGWSLGESGWKDGMDANFKFLDNFGIYLSVLDRDLLTPPGSPANGATYIMPSGTLTGAWSARAAGDIAMYSTVDVAWRFQTPRLGYTCWIEDEAILAAYEGSGVWDTVGGGGTIDASAIVSGTIDIARLPAGALERLVIVADEAARFALTTASVQLGDTVKQTDTGLLYYVVDEANLGNAAGYVEYTAGAATSVPWSGVSSKPAIITDIAAVTGADDDVLQKIGGSWVNRTMAQLKTSLGLNAAVTGPGSAVDMALTAFDGTSGTLLQDRAITVSDVSVGSVTMATIAGVAFAIAATAPTAAAGASQAGVSASLRASDATASTDTAGAAAGGEALVEGGAAARNTSGNANGGPVRLKGGAGIGTGTTGQVLIDADGTSAKPALAFDIGGNTAYGMWYTGGAIWFSANGVSTIAMSMNLLHGADGATFINRFKRQVDVRTSSVTMTTGMYMSILSNEGATAKVELTLPSAASGGNFEFVVQDPDGIRIIANTGDTIRVRDKVTAAAGYIESLTVGSIVRLQAINTTEWFAMDIGGPWTDGVFTYDDTSLTTP